MWYVNSFMWGLIFSKVFKVLSGASPVGRVGIGARDAGKLK